MSALSQLNIIDLRPRLSVKPNPPELVKKGIISRRKRRGAIKGTCAHYNGPAVGFRANLQQVVNFVVAKDTENHQQRIGMDSLAYHFIITDDGQIYQTRDIDLISWHCAHPEGNEFYIAVHFPIGAAQELTAAQWASYVELHSALAADYGFPLSKMTGHLDWSSSLCPGTIMPEIRDYRSAPTPVAGYKPPVGLTVVAAPRVTREAFASVLASRNSPCTPLAGALFDICVGEGIDPGVALAIFDHESKCGTLGINKDYTLKNWGNVRSPEDTSLGAAIPIPGRGNFAQYPTWENGLTDFCRRLKGPKYAGAGLYTVETIIPKYAPSSDGNAPAAYTKAVIDAIASWQKPVAVKTTTTWRCTNKQGINIRTSPNLDGKVVRTVAFDQTVEVGLVKVDGDVETIRGDNRWLWTYDGFAWAGNFKQVS